MAAAQELMETLGGIRTALNADGYELAVVDSDPAQLVIRIEAGPDACAECLVPKELMSSMIEAVAPAGTSWRLQYPAD